MRELFNNSVEHGNKMDESKFVKYRIKLTKTVFELSVSDGGNGFHLDTIIEKERNDSIMRQRNRGLIALMDIGFLLETQNACINVSLELNKSMMMEEGEDSIMEIKIENGVAHCLVKKNLITPNIKDLVETMQKGLNEETAFNTVVIDFTVSNSIDSMGITFLVGVYKTYKEKGMTVELKGVTPAMLNLFKIMRLDKIFEIDKK